MVIHRAPLGSHERFIAYLTEHFGGAFPVWLAPEQVRVIPVMPEMADYACEVNALLVEQGFRSDTDTGDGRLPAKVRSAVTRKVPLIIVVGPREAEQRSVTVRDRSGRETPMALDAFVEHARELVRTRSLEGAGISCPPRVRRQRARAAVPGARLGRHAPRQPLCLISPERLARGGTALRAEASSAGGSRGVAPPGRCGPERLMRGDTCIACGG